MRNLEILGTGTIGIANAQLAAWLPSMSQLSQGLTLAGQLATVVIAIVTLWKLFQK